MRSRWPRAFHRPSQARSRCVRLSSTPARSNRAREGMEEDIAAHVRDKVDAIYRSESRRVLATLIRLLGDFDLAEEGMHDAFVAAVEQWGEKGIPANPRTWLISTGRFKAIDRLRRSEKFESADSAILDRLLATGMHEQGEEGGGGGRSPLILHLC